MKLLVLVLAVFAVGSQGWMVDQSPVSDRQVEMLKNAFWDYVSKATTAADESLKQIQQSELGKEVNMFISQSSEAATRFSDALRTQVAPLTQELLQKFNKEARQMRKRLEKDMTTFTNKIKPYTQELMTDLQKQFEDLQKQAATFAETMDPETLKSTLLQKTQSMNQDLQDQMGPYTEDMRQQMEKSFGDLQSSLMALSQSFETQMNEKMVSFAPYGEEIRDKFELEAENMREQLETLWKSFSKMVKG
ncbi:apolipoprotein A-I-like [Periophthalmus magnuspinnatus]|uniref:apolipoprotein A-I-like n=1 Tax=Periophthalmus magnuspinnatus TaxID=409849 RepID=UPI00145A0F33|nr:apolipoprotein A-I-like [Periophthalmus magnuspinnatus]